MSPEQITALRELDHRSDLYSTGCVLFEAFAGRAPFVHPNEGVVLNRHLNEAPPDVREFRADVPAAAAAAIARAMAKAPEDRWPDAAPCSPRSKAGRDPGRSWQRNRSGTLRSGGGKRFPRFSPLVSPTSLPPRPDWARLVTARPCMTSGSLSAGSARSSAPTVTSPMPRFRGGCAAGSASSRGRPT
jgi:serine/threonine-protein kinase